MLSTEGVPREWIQLLLNLLSPYILLTYDVVFQTKRIKEGSLYSITYAGVILTEEPC